MAKIKLAAFDLEGTVFKKIYRAMAGKEFESAWGALSSYLGEDAAREDEVNRNRYHKEGNYSYSTWVRDTIKIYQKYGLKKDCFDKMINSVEYHDGVAETFRELRNNGIITATISGGLKALADRVGLDHKVEHSFTSAELFWCPQGTLHHWNIIPTDFVHKRSVFEILLQELGIDRSEAAFVGDGINDVDIAAHAGMSIAFNSKYEELKAVAHHTIDQRVGGQNLSAVLDFIIS